MAKFQTKINKTLNVSQSEERVVIIERISKIGEFPEKLLRKLESQCGGDQVA